MEKRPLELTVMEQQHNHLIITPYAKDVDPIADRAAADAALNVLTLHSDAAYGLTNGGFRETIASGGIVTVEEALKVITVTMAGAWEGAGPTKRIIPIVRHAGEAIPFVGTGGKNGITDWDGLAAAKTITIDNDGGRFVADNDDAWEVTLIGDLPGFLQSLDAGGVSLPTTVTKNKSVGYSEPTFSKITNDGEEVTGSFTFYEVVNAIKKAAAIFNYPGEDVEKRIWGSDWSANGWNRMTYLSQPIALSILQYPGYKKHDDTKVGQVFCIEQRLYGLSVNNVPNPTNKAADATAPILKQFDFTCVNGIYRKVWPVEAEA